MKVTFNGNLKIITINPLETMIRVQEDLYSAWKTWISSDVNNLKFPSAFRTIGGDFITNDVQVSATFFIQNGWKIRPYEGNHTLTVVGNLYVDGSTESPFIRTLGNYNVLINTQTSNIVNTVVISSDGSGGSSMGPVELRNQDKQQIIQGVKDELQQDFSMIKGLLQNNFRITGQQYDSKGRLLSATIKLYHTSSDLLSDTNNYYQMNVQSTYDNDRLIDYKVWPS